MRTSTGIYVRVSTEEQAQEGFSIRAQTEKLKAYALIKDWDLYDVYADEGISGKNITERPDINRLLDDIKNGKVNNVLVFKVDRLTRSIRDLIDLVELFDKHECKFNSLNESIDTDTPSGRMFLKIIGIFAEFERENLIARLRLGFERKAREGYTTSSFVTAYGYKRQKGQRVQEIDPEEAQTVREVFRLYLDEDKTLTNIVKILNDKKIKPKQKTSMWAVKTIKEMLSNPIYTGKIRYSVHDQKRYFEVEGKHESIISDEIFAKVQVKLKNTSRLSPTKVANAENYFGGLLICERCGKKFTTQRISSKDKNGKRRTSNSYTCMGKERKNDGRDYSNRCTIPDASHKNIEIAFVNYIENISDFTETDGIDEFVKQEQDRKEQERKQQFAELEEQRKRCFEKKKKLMEQYVSEILTFDEYRNMIAIANDKFDQIENELIKLEEENNSQNHETDSLQKEDIITNFKESWGYLDNKERQNFLKQFVKAIEIDVEKLSNGRTVPHIKKVEFNIT